MYVIRSALRASTGRPPARFICGRRYPSIPRPRSIHTTRALAQAAKPPPGSGNTPIGGHDISKPDPEKAAAEEHADAAVASEDPELLAQKLQRSRETSRRYSAALRRQQRSKKSPGLPPVHVPDWFLKERVTRHEDLLDGAGQHKRPASLSVTVSDAASGEQATCSIPASDDVDAVLVLSRLVRGLWKRRLDDDQRGKIEIYMSERIALADKTTTQDADGESHDPSTAARTELYSLIGGTDRSTEKKDANESAVTALMHKWGSRVDGLVTTDDGTKQTRPRSDLAWLLREFEKQMNKPERIVADPTWNSQQKWDAVLAKKEARLERWIKTALIPSTSRQTGHISPLVLAEIRASIAASLSALRPSLGDSFPSAKTNLIIHSPTAGQEEIVDACIHKLAGDLHSDVIVLTAQDLAQLGGDYLGEGQEPTPRSIRSLGYETYRLSAELRGTPDDITEGTENTSEPETQPMELPEFLGIRAFTLPLDAMRATFRGLKSQGEPGLYDTTTNASGNANIMNDTGRAPSQNEMQLEDLKLATLLDTLIDANDTKHNRGLTRPEDSHHSLPSSSEARSNYTPRFFDYSVGSEGTNLELNSALPEESTNTGISMSVGIGSSLPMASIPERPKIIYVKDFKELNATHYGGRIIQKLEELVRKRRTAGESIMIIGSTCSRELTPELSVRYDRLLHL
jgi:hypothetical protein